MNNSFLCFVVSFVWTFIFARLLTSPRDTPGRAPTSSHQACPDPTSVVWEFAAMTCFASLRRVATAMATGVLGALSR